MLDILDSGISEVYYHEDYRDSTAVDFLRAKGVKVEKLENI